LPEVDAWGVRAILFDPLYQPGDSMLRNTALLLALAAGAIFTNAQQTDASRVQAGKNQKKSFTLRGVVEGVDAKSGRLTVNHGAVEGWMGAMTMAYAVDKPEDAQKVKVGDHIEATVYQDEYKLYDIKVVPQK
jgi:Cu/Ag efflux protein CusF